MKRFLWVMVVLLGAGFSSVALAGHDHSASSEKCSTDSDNKMCDKSGDKSMCGKCGQMDESSPCPIMDKIMKKAHFFLDNKDEIELSEDQVAQIKAIKMQTKKAAIRMGAEMQIFELDLKSKLDEPKVDVEGISAMMDQGMAGMSKSGKENVQSYADLKAILTEAQMAKAKEIWNKK